jgi:thioredoxin-dependent peroxiredoxin
MRRAVTSALFMVGGVLGCATRGEPVGKLGADVPKVSAPAHDGSNVDFTDPPERFVVVYFYPKNETPGCTKEACAFRDAWARYESADVEIVGVSADSLQSHRKFAENHELPFRLVSDADLTWAEAFGVSTMFGMHARTSFLVSPEGTIEKVYENVDPGVHANQVLADVKALRAK